MKVFITFGSGGQNYIDAGKRLIKQAKLTGYFDKIKLYTEKDLIIDEEFWNRHSKFISENKRGYGYWIWKSYIIKKTMENMKNGDILLYLDCGCEIGGSTQKLIPKFFNHIKKDKIIGTETHNDKDWCKMDLLLHFDMQDSDLIHNPQHQAGAIMFYICEKTKFIVDLWYETCCYYHMIDDSPSIKPNLNCFKEHRHDQAIFSLITKKYNIYSNESLSYCIHYLRNKTGISKINKDDNKMRNTNTIMCNISQITNVTTLVIVVVTLATVVIAATVVNKSRKH
jgi:hypothetical protein